MVHYREFCDNSEAFAFISLNRFMQIFWALVFQYILIQINN